MPRNRQWKRKTNTSKQFSRAAVPTNSNATFSGNISSTAPTQQSRFNVNLIRYINDINALNKTYLTHARADIDNSQAIVTILEQQVGSANRQQFRDLDELAELLKQVMSTLQHVVDLHEQSKCSEKLAKACLSTVPGFTIIHQHHLKLQNDIKLEAMQLTIKANRARIMILLLMRSASCLRNMLQVNGTHSIFNAVLNRAASISTPFFAYTPTYSRHKSMHEYLAQQFSQLQAATPKDFVAMQLVKGILDARLTRSEIIEHMARDLVIKINETRLAEHPCTLWQIKLFDYKDMLTIEKPQSIFMECLHCAVHMDIPNSPYDPTDACHQLLEQQLRQKFNAYQQHYASNTFIQGIKSQRPNRQQLISMIALDILTETKDQRASIYQAEYLALSTSQSP